MLPSTTKRRAIDQPVRPTGGWWRSGEAQAALPGLIKIVADWRPDLVVRETCEFGSLIAAEGAGIPQVEVAVTVLEELAATRGLNDRG